MVITKENYRNYQRIGRGKSFQFCATDDEVGSLLKDELPKEFSPYTVVAVDTKMVSKGKFQQVLIESPICSFQELRKAGQWYFFIRSTKLSPSVDVFGTSNADTIMNYSGFIALRHGLICDGTLDVSTIGIVPEIVDRRTQMVHKHNEYLNIYEHFVRAVKRTLLRRGFQKWGNAGVSPTKLGMTDGFVKAVREGLLKTRVEVHKGVSPN